MTDKETSLTAPSDRDPEKKYRPELGAPTLTEPQVKNAMDELNITSFIERFPKVERAYADPAVNLQKIGLVSFVPAKGATPNDKGIFGFAKLRGNYDSESEANERAEWLVRNVDSYHPIYHTYVGRPFPLTVSSEYSKEVSRVDLKKETTASISADVKAKRDKELKEINEVKEREKELLEDVKKDEEDEDRYITLRVKKAQLAWTYLETEKKMEQMVSSIVKAKREIEELEAKDSSLHTNYREKYMEARRKAGLPVDDATADTTFMRYLVEEADIPQVDVLYKDLYGDEPVIIEANVEDVEEPTEQ